MAQKRMFCRSIIEMDSFLDLPNSSKALYFLLGMEADDEGFVSPKRVLRLYQFEDDNLRILIAKGFVIPFQNNVIVITHWHSNNYLDGSRIKSTKYKEEKAQLLLTEDNSYVFNNGSTRVEESSVEERRIEENRITTSANAVGEKETENERRAELRRQAIQLKRDHA
jgi:hypothetical protein